VQTHETRDRAAGKEAKCSRLTLPRRETDPAHRAGLHCDLRKNRRTRRSETRLVGRRATSLRLPPPGVLRGRFSYGQLRAAFLASNGLAGGSEFESRHQSGASRFGSHNNLYPHRTTDHFDALRLGVIHDVTKSAIAGNSATRSPRTGTPMKLANLSQKSIPISPGSVLVIWLSVVSRESPA
jgi:hypothetical protein